jgi:hypothetical protein
LDFNSVFIFEFCNRYASIIEICKLIDCCCEEFEFGNRFGFGFGFEFEFEILEMDLEFCIRDYFWILIICFFKKIYIILDGLGPNHPE